MEKICKSIDEQIEILAERNLKIDKITFAKKILMYENYYYVINGYKDFFLASTSPDFYKKGARFNEIVALYNFDRVLREILTPDLLRIEHCIKSKVIDVFSKYHGHNHDEYLRTASFNNSTPTNRMRSEKLVSELRKQICFQENNAIRHYTEDYGYVPLWVLSTAMTFGKVINFYGCMLQQEKAEIANSFELTSGIFKPLLEYMVTFRNKCAHGNRIYCHAKDNKPPRPIPNLPIHKLLNIPSNSKGYKYGTHDVLALLITMKYFMHPNRYEKMIGKIEYALHRKLGKRLTSIDISEVENIKGLKGDWASRLSLSLSDLLSTHTVTH